MTIKEIDTTVCLTINLGNYESAKIQSGMKVSICEDENYKEVFKSMWIKCKEEVKEQAKIIKEKRNSSFT